MSKLKPDSVEHASCGVCAEAYQVLGAMQTEANKTALAPMLDKLAASGSGKPVPNKPALPFTSPKEKKPIGVLPKDWVAVPTSIHPLDRSDCGGILAMLNLPPKAEKFDDPMCYYNYWWSELLKFAPEPPVAVDETPTAWIKNDGTSLTFHVQEGKRKGWSPLFRSPEVQKVASIDLDELTSRFMEWKLPKDFNPDGGISFNALRPDGYPNKPSGTNLMTFSQARKMFEELLGDV